MGEGGFEKESCWKGVEPAAFGEDGCGEDG